MAHATSDDDTRARLLGAAEHVFNEKGVDRAEVEAIVTRANVPHDAFSRYFPSKQDALEEIVQGWLTKCGALFAGPTDYPETPDDPGGVLDFAIERDLVLYDFFWRTRSTVRLLRASQAVYGFLFDAFRADMKRRNVAWFETWKREGWLRPDLDVPLAATLFGGAYEELTYAVIHSEERPPLQAWLEFAQETFMRAYGSPDLVAALQRRKRRIFPSMKVPAAYGAVPHEEREPTKAGSR